MFKFLKLFGFEKSPREKLKGLLKNDSGDSVRNMKRILKLLIKNPGMFNEYQTEKGYYFELYDKNKSIDTRIRIFKTTHTTKINPADDYERYVFIIENNTSGIEKYLILIKLIKGKKKGVKYLRKSSSGEKIKTLFLWTGGMVFKLYEKVNTPKHYLR